MSTLRPVGTGPFLAAGQEFVWHYRRRSWQPGMPETAFPMRVVRDDERGLVSWLAPDTVGLVPERTDGRGRRDDKATMFTAARRQGRGAWSGHGNVRIIPTGTPWSVWLFRTGPEPAAPLSSWYLNPEDPARRTDTDLVTSDLVLDLVITPDRSVAFKDRDELVLAVEQARFTAAEAAEIETFGARAEESFRDADWPFDDEWTHWSPPAEWSVPVLPRRFSI